MNWETDFVFHDWCVNQCVHDRCRYDVEEVFIFVVGTGYNALFTKGLKDSLPFRFIST